MGASDDPRRVHFQSPEYLVDRLDAIAELFDKDRTDLLVEAIREYIEETADSEKFQELVATKYYDDQLEFETIKQLVGAETAQRLHLLKADLEDEPLDLADRCVTRRAICSGRHKTNGSSTGDQSRRWPRLASDLGCTDVVRRRAEKLAAQTIDVGVTTGVHPAGFAAACLYMAACVNDPPLTQSDAAAAAEVTVETVRNHRDRLLSIVE
jgi:hypothetical protein